MSAEEAVNQKTSGKLTLTELEPARVADDTRVPKRSVCACRQERLAIVAVVADKVWRRVVIGPLLEQARRCSRRVQEPLLSGFKNQLCC